MGQHVRVGTICLGQQHTCAPPLVLDWDYFSLQEDIGQCLGGIFGHHNWQLLASSEERPGRLPRPCNSQDLPHYPPLPNDSDRDRKAVFSGILGADLLGGRGYTWKGSARGL